MAPNRSKQALLYVALFSFIIIGLNSTLLNTAWLSIKDSFGVELDSLGILLTAGTFGYLTATFTSGTLIKRIGTGLFLVGGTAVGVIGIVGTAFAPSWEVLLIAAYITTLGTGTIDAGMNTFVSANFSAGPLNWLHAFFGVGATIGPWVVALFTINLSIGWQGAYLFTAVLQIALVLILLLTLPRWRLPTNGTGDDAEAEEPEIANAFDSLRRVAVLLGALMFFIYGGVEIGAAQLSNSLFVDGRGIDEVVSTAWISFYWGSFTFGRMIMGVIADRVNIRLLMRIATLLAVVGTVLLWANITEFFGFLGLALIGFALAPMFATWTAQTPGRVGLAHAPNAIGFQIGVTGLGGSVLSGVAAAIAADVGLEFIGVFLVINATVMLLLHEYILWRDTHIAARVAASSAD